jgi:excisionase family DNA binding protein
MKIDLEHSDIQAIAAEVVKAIKPLLAKGKAEDDTIFTVKTLAAYLHVSDQWVYERVALNEIPFSKTGKFPRFRKRKIDRWIDSLETPAISPLSGLIK